MQDEGVKTVISSHSDDDFSSFLNIYIAPLFI